MGDWSQACPLRGICPECGQEFDWADMVGSPRRRMVRVADTMSDWFGLSRTRTRQFFRWLRYRVPSRWRRRAGAR
jgi:hypothetical protein